MCPPITLVHMVPAWMCCNDCSVAPGQAPHTGPGQPSPISGAVNPLVQCGPTATTTATATLFVHFFIFSPETDAVCNDCRCRMLDSAGGMTWPHTPLPRSRDIHMPGLNLAGKLERSWFLQQTLLTSRQSSVSVFLNWICRKMNIAIIRNASEPIHSNICKNINLPVQCNVVYFI